MTQRSDEELLLAAGQGDRQAFGQVVERHHRGVVQFIHRLLGTVDRDQAEDLAQDVFLRAWKGAQTYRPKAKCSTWLLQIARNTSLNHQRAQRHRRTRPLDEHDSPEYTPDHDDRSEAEGRDRIHNTRMAIASLPEKQRAAVILRHFHDFSYSDIAAVLGLSVSAVETVLFRARKALRIHLKNRESQVQVLPTSGVSQEGKERIV